jgi:hypothetical protein
VTTPLIAIGQLGVAAAWTLEGHAIVGGVFALQAFSRIETVALLKFATARSRLPSPLKIARRD